MKKGDKVVCVDDKLITCDKYKVYNILDIYYNKISNTYYYFLFDKNGDYSAFSEIFFISLSDYRKQKLQTLKKL